MATSVSGSAVEAMARPKPISARSRAPAIRILFFVV
jgi:hypothetical protein